MADRWKSVLLFGPPGVGKGTQGKLLGQIPGFRHVATGDIFRSLDRESELGRQFHEYSSKGELVPDELTIQVWHEYVERLISDGHYAPARDLLVLDGIPRSVAQAEAIDPHIDMLGIIELRAPDIDEMVKRMKKRALEQGRTDDADEAVIRRRFQVYDDETAPVLSLYDTSLVTGVPAVGTPAEVLMNVLGGVVGIYTANFGNPLA